MCSSYDYSQEAVNKLTDVLESASPDEQETILDDEKCQYFLSELGIKLQQKE